MFHTFKYVHKGKPYYFLWESEGGSLCKIDYAAFLVCGQKEGLLDETEKKALESLDKNVVAEIEQELSELKEEPVDYTKVGKFGYTDLKAMCLHICHDCNLRCKYCFASEGTYNTPRDYMSAEVGKKAIDFLIAKSGKRVNMEVDFFGGEPLLNFDVVKEIVAYARSREKQAGKKFLFTMTTNGLLLNKEAREWLNAEMENVVISLDGRKDVHNACRKTANGKDVYDLIVNNALEFRKIRGDKKYYIRGTFTHDNIDFASDVLAINDLGFDQISIEPVVLEKGNPLALTEEDMPKVLSEYERLTEEYVERRKGSKWFSFFHYMLDLEHGSCIKKRLTGCGAGVEYLAVTPTGDLYPCHRFTGDERFKMGTVYDEDFNRDIQARFASCNLTNKPGCADCWAKFICSGGCSANNFYFEGDMSKPFGQTCLMMRKRIEQAMAINFLEKYDKQSN